MNVVLLDRSESMHEGKKLIKKLISGGQMAFFVADRPERLQWLGDDLSHVGHCTAAQFVSMIRRKEYPHLNTVTCCKYLIFCSDAVNTMWEEGYDSKCSQELLYWGLTLKMETIWLHDSQNEITDTLSHGNMHHAFETFDLQQIMSSGGYVMPWDDVYKEIILRSMGGQAELEGHGLWDGKMLLTAQSEGSLEQMTAELGSVKDIIELDVDYENVMKWCRNCCLPGVERLDLAAVLLNKPLHGVSGCRPELTEHDWEDLMNAMDEAGYPYIIATELLPGKGWSSVPSNVISRCTHVVQVLTNDIFVAVLKDANNMR